MSDYQKLNEKLQALQLAKKSRLDLQEISRLYQQLNLFDYPKIHIAGTNGKGSCVKKVSEALTLCGYKTASYTSPHIATFRERILIDGEMISKSDVEKFLPSIFLLAEKPGLNITFFEAMTLLAFKYFAEKKVDVAVIEVGLGGRLDATNCITPILSVITSISLDHTDLLGDTLEKIAAEKGGIIKKNIPVVLGPNAQQKILMQMAHEQNAKVTLVKVKNQISYDQENQQIAKVVLNNLKDHFELDDSKIAEALNAKPMCRYQKVHFSDFAIILDVSHNEDGLQRLFEQIQSEYPKKKKIVFTSMAYNHDYSKNLEIISSHASSIYILDILHPRLANQETLLSALSQLKQNSSAVKVEEVLKMMEDDKEALYIFTGSFFIMSPLLALFKIQVEKDEYLIADGLFKK